MKKLYNPNLAKIHRSYTVRELAKVFGVHFNTVGQWIKKGLPVCEGILPFLIRGVDAREFHRKNRVANKRPCQPGEIYCMGCQKAKTPSRSAAIYKPMTATSGAIIGICGDCGSTMFRRTSLAKLDHAKGDLDLTIQKGESHIGDTSHTLVDREPKEGAYNHV